MDEGAAIAYQFMLMIILASLLAIQYITIGEFNDILLGALIGSFSGVPLKFATAKKEKEVEDIE